MPKSDWRVSNQKLLNQVLQNQQVRFGVCIAYGLYHSLQVFKERNWQSPAVEKVCIVLPLMWFDAPTRFISMAPLQHPTLLNAQAWLKGQGIRAPDSLVWREELLRLIVAIVVRGRSGDSSFASHFHARSQHGEETDACHGCSLLCRLDLH